jgi:hypothetical protein
MKGKKLILLAMAIVLLLVIPAVVLAAKSDAKAHAKPPTNISAKFTFDDDGTTLTITGKAKGMDSGHPYVTLIYGHGSVVNGVDACEPPDPNLVLGARMLVGTWTVAADGTGLLGANGTVTNITHLGNGTVARVPLSDIATISVRGGILGGPGTVPVILCGKVK